ncbi:MAG: hypothetical protein LBI14_11700 [Treponema sp.]|jgi:hypothetical protein|nr:hypothetical protein [Treponema sp.]
MLKKLGKLLKYEFRFYLRVLPPIYIAIMVMSLVVRIQEKMPKDGTPFLLPLAVLGALITAMAVITIILIIQRFTDNFMKDPGALMFTLPVTVWALTASKAIAAFCMILMSALAVAASGFIYVVGTLDWTLNIPATPLQIIVYSLVVFIMIFFQICLIYGVITASHILPRFRFAAGCAAYLVITYFLQETVFRLVSRNSILERGVHLYGDEAALSLIPMGLATLALTALFFWATGFLLKRSFNLE